MTPRGPPWTPNGPGSRRNCTTSSASWWSRCRRPVRCWPPRCPSRRCRRKPTRPCVRWRHLPDCRVIMLTTFDLDRYVYDALAPSITRRLVEKFAAADRDLHSQTPAIHRDLTGLTPREAEVLTLMGRGLSNSELADALTLSEAGQANSLAVPKGPCCCRSLPHRDRSDAGSQCPVERARCRNAPGAGCARTIGMPMAPARPPRSACCSASSVRHPGAESSSAATSMSPRATWTRSARSLSRPRSTLS